MKNNLLFLLVFAISACGSNTEEIPFGNEILTPIEIKEFKGNPRNIILIIGDGTGLNQISLSRMAIVGESSKLYIDQLPFSGISLTHSADSIVTDSAAAATSWATGHKTNNRYVSVSPQKKSLPTLPEMLYKKGFLSGIVATSSITHATPAAFYSHVDYRYKEKEIASQLQSSDISIALGGGTDFFNTSIHKDNIDYIFDVTDLNKIEPPYAKKILGLFDSDGINRSPENPTQLLMTKTALHILSKKTSKCSGFFLMSEGSQIDWASHDNDAKKMIEEFRDFDLTIGAAINFVNSRDDTLLIITSDHETGGLQILKQAEGNIIIQWGTGSHTGIPVGVFSYGPGAGIFTGTMDNTDIHYKILDALNYSDIPDSSC